MRRDRIKHLERVDFAREQVPVVYLLFDLIYLNGEWLTDRSFEERYDRYRRLHRRTTISVLRLFILMVKTYLKRYEVLTSKE